MVALLFFLSRLLVSPLRSISRLEAENAALRRQLIVLRGQRARSGPVHEQRSPVLPAIVSVVSIDREGNDDHSPRDAGAMASRGFRPWQASLGSRVPNNPLTGILPPCSRWSRT